MLRINRGRMPRVSNSTAREVAMQDMKDSGHNTYLLHPIYEKTLLSAPRVTIRIGLPCLQY
jgi:hypothetical protein